MKEYQAVILRTGRHAREDEEALTDLLNERSRGGWRPAMMTQDTHRITVEWVQGHAGHVENERCDVLATTAAAANPSDVDVGYETRPSPP